MNCRHCSTLVENSFLDLGFTPYSNAFLSQGQLSAPERNYPLRLQVCSSCWLVQTEENARPEELFSPDYAYFSSVSESWVEHAAQYATDIISRLGLCADSFVIEVGANDGYLLKNFVAAEIPCLGIEPTASTADAAECLGISIRREFFSEGLAKRLATEGCRADLIVGNNVYAHVPDINDFTAGLKTVLQPNGTITLEFPHLLRLIEHAQFDTVYHEHFSYLSLYTVDRIFARAGLRIYDVDELSTHGGSLRVYGCHADGGLEHRPDVSSILEEEERKGLRSISTYDAFQNRVDRVKDGLLAFLTEQKHAGTTVAAYGAAAKGNTLLNYAGVKPDLLPFVCDAAASKQGKYLPGSHIPILAPSALREYKPDSVLILPWNIADEVIRQHSYIRDWGGRFVVAVPRIKLLK